MKRFVQVTMTGYFEIDEADLAEAYEGATTFEQAVQHQRDLLEEDQSVPFEELVNTELPTTVQLKLMSKDFLPI